MVFMRALLCLVLAILGGCSGGGSGSVTNLACPILGGPYGFSFSPVVGAPLDTLFESDTVTIRCGSNHGVQIVGGAYSIDGRPYTTEPGRISDGQRLQVITRSANTFDTSTQAIVQVGFIGTLNTVTAAFRVTTEEGDPYNAPSAAIDWPLDNATINASRITVTGHANDPDGIAEVLVNDILATSDDGFLTWSADVPLVFGLNTITISTADSFLNINPTAAAISIKNLAVVALNPVDLVVDEQRARVLVLDRELPALIAIDLEDGTHRLISDNETPDEDSPFSDPARIALSESGDIAWIIDNGYDDLIKVDLNTGSRSLLTDATVSNSATEMRDARDIAIDPIRNQALLLVGILSSAVNDTRVVAVDLATGARSLLSDATTPNTDNALGSLFDGVSMQFDSIGYRLLVFQEDVLLAVDPLTGQRTIFSPEGIVSPIDASADIRNNRVLVLNRYNSNINAVDLNSGTIEHLWDIPDTNPRRISLDADNNRTLMLYSPHNRTIFAIDMSTGRFSVAY